VPRTNADPRLVLARVTELAAEVYDGGPIDPDSSLLAIGLDSAALIRLLSRLQSEFDIEWDLDLPPAALDSLRSIVTFVLAQPDSRGRT
jgi:acyl carrier protein